MLLSGSYGSPSLSRVGPPGRRRRPAAAEPRPARQEDRQNGDANRLDKRFRGEPALSTTTRGRNQVAPIAETEHIGGAAPLNRVEGAPMRRRPATELREGRPCGGARSERRRGGSDAAGSASNSGPAQPGRARLMLGSPAVDEVPRPRTRDPCLPAPMPPASAGFSIFRASRATLTTSRRSSRGSPTRSPGRLASERSRSTSIGRRGTISRSPPCTVALRRARRSSAARRAGISGSRCSTRGGSATAPI